MLAVRTDAFAGIPGSVYEGRSVDLNLWLLALPLGVWIAGALLGGRAFAWLLARRPQPLDRFPHVVRGVLGRSLRRRSWVAAQGVIVIGLIVGAATSITMFTASYDQAKAADARFSLGSDIKVAPDPTNQETVGGAFAEQIDAVDGIAAPPRSSTASRTRGCAAPGTRTRSTSPRSTRWASSRWRPSRTTTSST